MILKDLEGAKTRSRVQWLEEGEKPTLFFFKLERERADKNFVSSILDNSGREVFSRQDIERVHVNFYTDLFSPKVIDDSCTHQLLDSVSRTLSPAYRELCDENVSLAELANAVNSLSLNTSPGPDSLSVEFYRHFWDKLGPFLLRVAHV